MCNPRKVMIHIAESLNRAWREAITASATRSGEVEQFAALTAEIELDRELGPAASEMLERVLAGEFPDHPAWKRDDRGNFVKQLDQVELSYSPAAQKLTMTARLAEMATAEVTKGAEICGVTTGTIAFEAIGHYYEDGWSNRTEEKALAEAREQAAIRLERALYELERESREKTLAPELEKLEKEAADMAALELERKRVELRSALRRRLEAELAGQRQEAFYTINRAIGEAYRQTLCQLVVKSGGRVISEERTGTVIDLELEL